MEIVSKSSHNDKNNSRSRYTNPLQIKILEQCNYNPNPKFLNIAPQAFGVIRPNDPELGVETIALMSCFSFSFITESPDLIKSKGGKYILMTHFGIPKESEFISTKIIEQELQKFIHTKSLTEKNHAFLIFHKSLEEMPAISKTVQDIINKSKNRLLSSISKQARIIEVPYSKTMPLATGFASLSLNGEYKTDISQGNWKL